MSNPLTTQEHSQKMKGKKCHLGKKHTDEAKLKMHKAHKGKKLSEEHKEKIRQSMCTHFKNKKEAV